ncbi:sugar porter family MFS transporter [Pseudonocardia sp. C8]|uniref:sugar porter family MFS transporter n=1 Tax=Pseudonocardia sp. C8 TaxID=2762759 RepID=UPI0016434B51|nr:sugar porter family MFS transporter [Pseudonocardia sp. C8]
MGFLQELRGASRLGVLVAASAATVGVIYGYDQSNIAGALLFMTDEFGLSTQQQEQVATVVVIGQILGAIGGGSLANRIGRKPAMIAVAVGFGLFSLLSALAWSVPMLLVSRLLLGVTIGVSIVVAPVFVAESSPAKIRGAMLVLYQVATVVGIIAGYLVAWALAGTGSWRWMLGLAAVPAVLVTVMIARLPDTARWYAMRGRIADARAVLERLEPGTDVDAHLAEITTESGETTRRGAWREMLRRPYLRATLFVLGLGFFIQITGINAIVYYSPRIFEAMGFTGNAALLGLPALVQVAGLVAVLGSLVTVDRMGRRPVLLGGIGIMVVANLLLVVVFATGGGSVLGFLGLVLFTVGFTFGFGSLVWVYAGEAFPSRLRSLGASTMLTADLVANAVVAAFFLTMLTELGGAGTFVVFGVLALLALVFVHRLAPETRGRELEEIRGYWENGGTWAAPQKSVES